MYTNHSNRRQFVSGNEDIHLQRFTLFSECVKFEVTGLENLLLWNMDDSGIRVGNRMMLHLF